MSDRDVIIQFLEKARRRRHSNSRFAQIATALAIALALPVAFKLLDLAFLFRARTVTAFFVVWAVTTIVWIFLKLKAAGSLTQVAAGLDRRAGLQDQLKTAYWFIQNPRPSEWVDAQIRIAARETSRLPLDSLYPRVFPRASYLAGALLFSLVVLNFVPLSLNHNWLYLQAAPAFQLTEEERISLENALRLLEKARAAENQELAQRLEDLISDLEQGNISLDEAIQQLEQIQDELEQSEAEAGETTNGIQQMAAILRQARALRDAASPMAQGDLAKAAEQLRQLGDRLGSVSPSDMTDMAERLEQASENPRGSLQDLAAAFESTSAAIKKGDRAATEAGLDRIANELESIKQRIDSQELVADASEELGNLLESLQEREQQEGEGDGGEPGKSGNNQGKGEQQSEGETGGEGEAGEGGDPQDGQPGDGEQGGESTEAGENPGSSSEDAPNGRGGNSFGGSTKSAPLEGELTTLEVQLQQEALKIEATASGSDPDKEKQAAGEQERSKLDYRNAPTDLTPAEKDLLNQDRIPWESRQLIKNYFQAVKPKQTK